MEAGALFFLIGAAPLLVLAGVSDLRTMTIPNWISVALLAVFIVLGVIFLPLETVLYRLAAGLCMLVLVFFLNAVGIMGGGDAKLIAASTPFVAFRDVAAVLFFFSVALIVTLVVHRVARAIPAIRRATPDWKSWVAGRNFPMGISIAATMIFYLAARVIAGA